tara:strand:+ start:2420 stop:3550 length:1131 start_codon:yes stop_codon:yes gene_type:complete
MEPIVTNKGLLIHGLPGSGKTFIGTMLLKDTIMLRIDTNSLKLIKNIKSYILDRLTKKSVTMMFGSNKSRGVLIDDLHVFYKYDKIAFRSIIEFLKEGSFYGAKVIATCCNTFLKNKELAKLKTGYHEIINSKSVYYNKCLSIVKKRNKCGITHDKLMKLITNSNLNLNSFCSELSLIGNSNILLLQEKDTFDPIVKITENLLLQKYSIREIFRICENDEMIIGFNLLENYLSYITDYGGDNDIFLCLIQGDISQSFMVRNNDSLSKNYFMLLSICQINSYIHKYPRINPDPDIIYNKYISKSMASIISFNSYLRNPLKNDSFIIYLLDTFSETGSECIRQKLLSIYNELPKELENVNKKYKYFYDSTINLKSLGS